MFSHFPDTPMPDSSLPSTAKGTFQILVDIIASGQATGAFKAGDPEELALGRWALVHGLAMLILDGMITYPKPTDVCPPIPKTLIQGIIANSLGGLMTASAPGTNAS